ncbi:MAG TPA: hypothetical protein PKE27_14805 [Povalibacter sp.]|uniref:hypothetical protein n=1 Tax=Povalibacter sp. TaxID=1962978 RepID=UPI002C686823|nr:hypothetical protein [Povalibacter sp.]HMN45846.1 hypothetical protein [Povalibacter sp.]
MDLKYIQNEHIVDRYLAGELTVREAREFEQYCLENPAFLGKLPIPVRLKARLARKPLEASETGMFPAIPSSATRAALEANDEGFDAEEEDEKWERSRPAAAGGNRLVVMGLAIALIAALGGLVAYGMYAASLSDKLQDTQRQIKVTSMQAPAAAQTYRLQLVNSKPAGPTLALGWMQPPQLLTLVIDAREETFATYEITIDRSDGTRVMQMKRIARDSNKEVTFGLNSSAFGPGEYVLKVEGYTWRGERKPVGWASLGLE